MDGSACGKSSQPISLVLITVVGWVGSVSGMTHGPTMYNKTNTVADELRNI